MNAEKESVKPLSHPQHFCPANLRRLEFDESPVGFLQGVFLDFRFDVHVRRELEKAAHIDSRDVSDAFDLLLQPKVFRITEVKENFFVDFFLSDCVDDEPTTRLEIFQCLDDRDPCRCRVDDGIKFLR